MPQQKHWQFGPNEARTGATDLRQFDANSSVELLALAHHRPGCLER